MNTNTWRVCVCSGDCVHIHINEITLTLTRAEFIELQQLLTEALSALKSGPPSGTCLPH